VDKPDETIDAFISYQSEEEAFAKKLASSIEGYSTDGRKLKLLGTSSLETTSSKNLMAVLKLHVTL